MKRFIVIFKSLPLISTIVLTSVLINSCELIFNLCDPEVADFCKLLSKAKDSEITDSATVLVREAADTLIIFHGTACAKSNNDGTQNVILIKGRQLLPSYVTNAAVFLNGWNHDFNNGDHQFAGNGVVIRGIAFGTDADRNKVLLWNTVGAMSDDNFDDPYSMCYNFTVVGWNTANIDVNIDQNDGGCDTLSLVQSNFYAADNDGSATALSSFTSFLKNDNFITGNTAAILPRGFVFGWGDCDDRHLLQLGYNLEHNESIMQSREYSKGKQGFNPGFQNNVSKIDSGFVSWETYTVFKDNDNRRDYRFGEMVSGMSGSDVRLIEPPYSFLPRDNTGFFGACNGSIKKEEFIVERIPFRYALPVLSGWELGYLCNDHHIQNIGIKIDEWSYTIDPVTNLGTLKYKLSSAINDDNSDDPNYSNHKVNILGFRDLLPGKSAGGQFADLIPFSPLGSTPPAFCRGENGELRVTIKNLGTAAAGPSKTTVTFGTVKVTLDTPEIPAGSSADLLFKIPANCFSPDCSFIIKVDSANQINEQNNENNNTANGFCLG